MAKNIAEYFNRLSRAHDRYRRQTDERSMIIANVNVISRSLKTKKKIKKPSSNLQIPPQLTPKCCINALSTNMVT